MELIRAEECNTPEQDQTNSFEEFKKQDISAIDIYAFGMLIRRLIDSVSVDDKIILFIIRELSIVRPIRFIETSFK